MRALLVILLPACTPSYESATERAATALCEREIACDWIDEDDMEDCLDDGEDLFQETWPAGECDGDIDDDGFDQCIDEIESLECDDWLDYLNVLQDCSASEVCQ